MRNILDIFRYSARCKVVCLIMVYISLFNVGCAIINHNESKNIIIDIKDNVVLPPLGNCTQDQTNDYYFNVVSNIHKVWKSQFNVSTDNISYIGNISEKSVLIEFKTDQYGNVSKVKLLRDSGIALLDDSAILAIKNASPIEHFPSCADNTNSIKVRSKFVYKIKENRKK